MVAPQLAAVLSKLQTLSTSDHASVVSLNIFVALLCACIVIGHLLEENRWMNESITALIIGLCTGIIILLTSGGKSSHLLVFSEDLFFIYLLPPIIFNAGFQVKKKQFFHNFITIMMFGAIGTLISCTIISLGVINFFKEMDIGSLDIGDFLAIGAIFAATDSVCTLQVLNQDETPLLYSLVFGEGVVNDATSVVLFNAIQSFDLTNINPKIALQFFGSFLYLFLTSTLLGVVVGLVSAYIIKTLYFGRHSTDREFALMMLMAYLSYIMAELFYLSGILTVFFCGIVMSHYTWHNVTESSRVTTKHAFATLSFVAETFIFLYVGMDALDIEKWRFVSDSPGTSVAVSAVLLALVMAGRAAFVFPLSFISNLSKKTESEKLSIREQAFLNAVYKVRAHSIARECNYDYKHYHGRSYQHYDPSTPKSVSVPLLGSGQDSFDDSLSGVPRPGSIRALLTTPTHTVHHYWRKFDNAFMRPMFGGRGFVPFVPGSPTERSVHNPPQWQ
ncbi:Na+/H+ exchanger [Corchorus olitorius]|uniref:Na+/H+ exchanger n=1 Tax=Corchorus olitorius TaxID=93759 RepID=A0A1R3GB79_9ROSI|nr:Na+/H+ exchanger [Corchorus olitorius]